MALLDQLPSSFVNTIKIPIILLRFIGIDFFDDKARIGNYCKLIAFICLAFTFMTGLMLFLIKIKEMDADILEIADAISCVVLVIQSISKILLFRNKRLLLRKVVCDIAELWPAEDQMQDKKELMDIWLRRTRTICDYVVKLTIYGILLYNGMSLILYFATRLFNENAAYMLPFRQYCPFEINALWKYLLVYLMQILATVTIYECTYLPCDMFLFTLTIDVSMLLRLLQYDLVNINVECRGLGAEESLDNLKNIIKRHQKILKLTETLDEIFSAMLFSILLFSSLIICFYGCLGIVVNQKFLQLVYLMAALEILISVFYIMLPGQILSDTSSGIADAAYESLWYESDVRFKKMILIIITSCTDGNAISPAFNELLRIRIGEMALFSLVLVIISHCDYWSQKPCKLRAMGYTDINFETFYKICGSTWSYLTVLNQMYQNMQST